MVLKLARMQQCCVSSTEVAAAPHAALRCEWELGCCQCAAVRLPKLKRLLACCAAKSTIQHCCACWQVWYSSCWSLSTQKAFQAALQAVLNSSSSNSRGEDGTARQPLFSDRVLRLLQHWQQHPGVTLEQSRSNWIARLDHDHSQAPIGGFGREQDRLALLRYLCTGVLQMALVCGLHWATTAASVSRLLGADTHWKVGFHGLQCCCRGAADSRGWQHGDVCAARRVWNTGVGRELLYGVLCLGFVSLVVVQNPSTMTEGARKHATNLHHVTLGLGRRSYTNGLPAAVAGAVHACRPSGRPH